jgi:hypothetical protein
MRRARLVIPEAVRPIWRVRERVRALQGVPRPSTSGSSPIPIPMTSTSTSATGFRETAPFI